MIQGLYLSAQGANAQMVRQDVLANNMANASTVGFKRDTPEFRFYRPQDMRHGMPARMHGDRQNAAGAITLDRTTTIFNDGSLKQTGREYDVAIQPIDHKKASAGFLHIRDANGQEFLTRNGNLKRDSLGTLRTADGNFEVLNPNGQTAVNIPLTVDQFEISSDGRIYSIAPDKTRVEIDRIGVVTAPLDQLKKAGHNRFEVDKQRITGADNAQLVQGALETSGVDPTKELVSLIDASRSFEANVNMLRMQDESLGRLLQSFSG